jgi:hypothetical protein
MGSDCIYPAQKRRLQHIYFGTCPELEKKSTMGNPRCPLQKLKLTDKKTKKNSQLINMSRYKTPREGTAAKSSIALHCTSQPAPTHK